MISSSCLLSVCGRRVGAGGKERVQERRDGSRMEGGRFQSQQRLREMFLQSWNTHFHYTHTHTTWQEGTDLDSDRDKEWEREWMRVFTCGVRLHSVTGSITPELCYCTRLTVFVMDRSQSGWQRQLVTPSGGSLEGLHWHSRHTVQTHRAYLTQDLVYRDLMNVKCGFGV